MTHRPGIGDHHSVAMTPSNEITLYTRPGCGLCHEMKVELERRGFRVTEIDIDGDRELKRRFGLDIPVAIRADGSILARHRLS
jgi:hypothetical protein